MFQEVASQLGSRAAWLLSGQFERIVAEYCFPLPVHLGQSRVIVRSADEATAMLGLQQAVLLGRGVTTVIPCVKALDLPRVGRFRVWVDWHEKTLRAQGDRVSSVIYYCHQTPAGFRIEMVDYTRLSMPELRPHFAALALSA
jgi:hypothetical protein